MCTKYVQELLRSTKKENSMYRVSQMTLFLAGGNCSYRSHLSVKVVTSSVPEYELNKDLLCP